MKIVLILLVLLGLFGCAKEDIELTLQYADPLPYKYCVGKKFEAVGDLKFRLEVYEVVTYFYLPDRRIDKTEYELQGRFYKIDNQYYIKWIYAKETASTPTIVRTDKLKEI